MTDLAAFEASKQAIISAMEASQLSYFVANGKYLSYSSTDMDIIEYSSPVGFGYLLVLKVDDWRKIIDYGNSGRTKDWFQVTVI